MAKYHQLFKKQKFEERKAKNDSFAAISFNFQNKAARHHMKRKKTVRRLFANIKVENAEKNFSSSC